ncbi:hypothetical protein D3C81_2154140 [compost metagenome]
MGQKKRASLEEPRFFSALTVIAVILLTSAWRTMLKIVSDIQRCIYQSPLL